MAGDMLPQVLEEMNSLPFEARPAVEGEVKQLETVALDGCLSTGNGDIARIEGDRPNKPSIRSPTSGSEGTKGGPGRKKTFFRIKEFAMYISHSHNNLHGCLISTCL